MLTEINDRGEAVSLEKQKELIDLVKNLSLECDIAVMSGSLPKGVDPSFYGEVLKVIRSLKDEDRTMIIVTHEMGFAREVASRIIFIDEGKIKEENTPEEFFNNPKDERLKEFLSKVL